MTTETQKSSRRIIELDGLRGLACLFVLIHHYVIAVARVEINGPIEHLLWGVLSIFLLGGVDLFYVLY